MGAGNPPPGPNVLMISIDTLRRDHVDRFASDRAGRMPTLSRLLGEGWVMADHQQCSNWTFPSVACTLTGKLPVEAQWVAQLERADQTVLPASLETLAETLEGHGYDTVLISSSSWLSTQWDTAQGYRVWERGGDDPTESVQLGLGRLSGAEPWLLHVHLTEPHAPYEPPEAYLTGLQDLPPITYDLTGPMHYQTLEIWDDIPPEEQAAVEAHLRERYRAETQYLDDQLALVWADLLDGGWLEDTVVVFWTDHGEQFWEHGHPTHAWDLAAEETDAVLGFWGPGVPVQTHRDPTHGTDLVPTLLHLLELPIPEDLPGYVVGTAPNDRLRFAAATARGGTLQSVTQRDLKLTFDWQGTLTLHDRGSDPREAVDLYTPDHPEVRGLWDALRPRAEALSPLVPSQDPIWPEL